MTKNKYYGEKRSTLVKFSKLDRVNKCNNKRYKYMYGRKLFQEYCLLFYTECINVARLRKLVNPFLIQGALSKFYSAFHDQTKRNWVMAIQWPVTFKSQNQVDAKLSQYHKTFQWIFQMWSFMHVIASFIIFVIYLV